MISGKSENNGGLRGFLRENEGFGGFCGIKSRGVGV